jgi:hypothetical protein
MGFLVLIIARYNVSLFNFVSSLSFERPAADRRMEEGVRYYYRYIK